MDWGNNQTLLATDHKRKAIDRYITGVVQVGTAATPNFDEFSASTYLSVIADYLNHKNYLYFNNTSGSAQWSDRSDRIPGRQHSGRSASLG